MFTSELLLFFFLGILSFAFVAGLFILSRKYKFNWGAWVLSILGAFLIVFTLAWSVSSAIEGEPRAASMGMVFFGIPALIFVFLARRSILRSNTK